MKVLGVTCSSKLALFSLVRDSNVVASPVERVDVGSLHEESEELEATLAEIGRALNQTKPDLVVLLMPEHSRFKKTYQELAPRVTLETLVRLAAVRAGIPIEVLPRPTVRARLKLDQEGDLASQVPRKVPAPVGKHWKKGRDVAALAALAGEAAA
jgi:hypothetical protein